MMSSVPDGSTIDDIMMHRGRNLAVQRSKKTMDPDFDLVPWSYNLQYAETCAAEPVPRKNYATMFYSGM